MLRRPIPFLLSLGLLAGGPLPLRAADITVPTDQPTLAAALGVAGIEDTILLQPGTYAEADLTVPGGLTGLTIRSVSGDPATVTLDASGGTHALTNLAFSVTLQGITVSGAGGTGVVAAGGATMLLTDCVFENCLGGGAAVDLVQAVGCVFRDNASADSTRAGGLTAVDAVVSDCLFTGNEGVQGGGLRVVSTGLTLDGSNFVGNGASEDGGAIYLENATYLIVGSVFADNRASTAGGAVYVENGDVGGPHLVSDCRFLDNGANLLGGGMHVRDLPGGDAAILTDVIFSGHTIIGSGGALSVRGCAAELETATFTGNSSSQGGAIHVADGTVSLLATLIAGNLGGGAVICEGASSATATCSNLFGNLGGDWIACLSGQQGGSDNLSVDPEFCSTQPDADRNWELQSDSPCLPDGASCSRIGALGVGCGIVPVEETTWGSVKRRFGN